MFRVSKKLPDPPTDAEPPAVAAARLPDPALFAAEIMLQGALDASGLTFEQASCSGAFVLVTGRLLGWTGLLRKHWAERLGVDGKPGDPSHGRIHEDETWAAWSPSEPPSQSAGEAVANNLSYAISAGRHCVCFVQDEGWVPVELLLVVDHSVEVQPLTGDDVTAVARRLFDACPTGKLSDEHATALTPRMLRLAKRAGKPVDDYIALLRTLAEAAAQPPIPAPAPVEPTVYNGSMREAPTLSRLHGMDEAVDWGLRLAKDLEAFRLGCLPWGDVDRGCLLPGPPGVGKTIYARALATTCKLTFHSGSYGEWLGTGSAHQGDLLKSMRTTFRQARADAPALIFVDEVDSFPNRATLKHHRAEWDIQVVNALLAEIDGNQGREGVVLLAACNHPHLLDPALTRSGRLDRHIRIGLPDRKALAAIIAEHLDGELAGADLSAAALAAAGSTGADCERHVRGARRRARDAKRSLVVRDLLDELRGVDGSEADRRLAAIHEAGHAVAICLLRPGAIGMVSLRGSSEAGGRIAVRPSADFPLATDIAVDIAVALAGRAAEEEIIGAPSAGAGGRENSDLALATHVALISATALGLRPESGLLWRGLPERAEIGEFLAANPETARQVADVLEGTYGRVRQLVRDHVLAVGAVAVTLLERGVLDGPEVEAIVREHSPARPGEPSGSERGR